MGKKVLVVHASKHGGTEEIAARIAGRLRDAGHTVDLEAAERAGETSGYDGVVVGAAVYIGRWRKGAVRFLRKNEAALAGRPVWVFASGPTGNGDPVELLKGKHVPGNVQSSLDRIAPREVALFHGVIDEKKLGPLERWMIRKVEAETGDFRDWEAVAEFAGRIAAALKGEERPEV